MTSSKDKQQQEDLINHPSHYTIGIEVLKFIQSWKLSFNEGNVVKYVVRAKYKGSYLADLQKARFYLDDMIKIYERDQQVQDQKKRKGKVVPRVKERADLNPAKQVSIEIASPPISSHPESAVYFCVDCKEQKHMTHLPQIDAYQCVDCGERWTREFLADPQNALVSRVKEGAILTTSESVKDTQKDYMEYREYHKNTE